MNESSQDDSSQERTPGGFPWGKLIVLAVVLAAMAFVYFQFGYQLRLSALAQGEEELRQFQSDHPVLVYAVAFTIYVALTGLSIPGVAAPLTLLFGWYFHFWRALLLISFASTTGSTLAFLLSRYLMRDWIQRRFAERLSTFNVALEREGAFYLFTLRLIPAVPFWMINLVMGLTPLRVRTFWWVSQLGMLPGTCVYVYAGTTVPRLQTLADEGIGAVISPWQLTQILVAFGLLGIFPLLVKKVMQRWQKNDE